MSLINTRTRWLRRAVTKMRSADLLGRRVSRAVAEAPARENTVEWKTTTIPEGFYLITVVRDGLRQVAKVQIKH